MLSRIVSVIVKVSTSIITCPGCEFVHIKNLFQMEALVVGTTGSIDSRQ
jgi:hypothetical protein